MAAAAEGAAAVASSDTSPAVTDVVDALFGVCDKPGGWKDRPTCWIGELGADMWLVEGGVRKRGDWKRLLEYFASTPDVPATKFPHFYETIQHGSTNDTWKFQCTVCPTVPVLVCTEGISGGPPHNSTFSSLADEKIHTEECIVVFHLEHHHLDLYEELWTRLQPPSATKSVAKRL